MAPAFHIFTAYPTVSLSSHRPTTNNQRIHDSEKSGIAPGEHAKCHFLASQTSFCLLYDLKVQNHTYPRPQPLHNLLSVLWPGAVTPYSQDVTVTTGLCSAVFWTWVLLRNHFLLLSLSYWLQSDIKITGKFESTVEHGREVSKDCSVKQDI